MSDLCPYLKMGGQSSDVPRPYPSHGHRCRVRGGERIIAPRTQAHFCLTPQHVGCPYFTRAKSGSDEPDRPLGRSTPPTSTIALILLALLFVAVLWTAQGKSRAAAEQPTVSAAAPSPTAMATLSPPTLTPTEQPAVVPSPTSAPEPTPSRLTADRPPDRIEIPSIHLDAPVVEVDPQVVDRDGYAISTWDVADAAAGFHRGSAYPGNVGNTVLSGHHNVHGEVFHDLVDVPLGADIVLYVGGLVFPYKVADKFILPDANVSLDQKMENARWIEPFPDERLTLVTCWPDDSNTHRLIVIAFPT